MDEIKKALQALADAIENQDSVASVKITITLRKPSKASSGKQQANRKAEWAGNRPS